MPSVGTKQFGRISSNAHKVKKLKPLNLRLFSLIHFDKTHLLKVSYFQSLFFKREQKQVIIYSNPKQGRQNLNIDVGNLTKISVAMQDTRKPREYQTRLFFALFMKWKQLFV